MNVPDTTVELSDIILRNGQDVLTFLQENDPDFLNNLGRFGSQPGKPKSTLSNSQKLNLLIARMMAKANYLCNDANFTFLSDTDVVKQTGLAYRWGGKGTGKDIPYYNKDDLPKSTECMIGIKFCGLDCSGMVYLMNLEAGFPSVVHKNSYNVTNIRDPKKWTTALENSEFNGIICKDMGKLPYYKLKAGDIILWGTQHVGICNGPAIYQSNGDRGLPGCSNNFLPTCGPNPKPLSALGGFNSGAYTVYRLFSPEEFVFDADGNSYTSITIGTQTWLQQDLRTTKFNNGISINNVTSTNDWVLTVQPSYCSYNNEQISNQNYGLLYNWYAVNSTDGLCPVGYHVATDEDWQLLEFTLGMDAEELTSTGYRGQGLEIGDRLKYEFEWAGATTTNANATDFSAKPGGGRSGFDGIFGGKTTTGFWWTSTEDPNSFEPFYRELFFNNSGINRNTYSKEHGFSVRCVKD
jgi:uncharacterized protein (TIGR02145 family)